MEQRRSEGGSVSTVLLIVLGAGLNQSSVIAGANVSVADIVLPLVVLSLALRGQLRIPLYLTLVFSIFTGIVLFSSITTPAILLGVEVDLGSVLVNYVKLVICFTYLLVAFNLARIGRIWTFFGSFVSVAVACGALGLLKAVVPAVPLPDLFYYGGVRFRGLMNDPNYFSIVQLAALAIAVTHPRWSAPVKLVLGVLLAASSLVSGSKTGVLALLVLLAWWILSWALERNASGHVSMSRVSMALLTACLLGLIAAFSVDSEARYQLASRIAPLPAVGRLAPLLLDVEEGMSIDGSGRTAAWDVALQIAGVSPITGIGVGTYLDVSVVVSGERVLAHNSFLQLLAEWGFPFAVGFLIFVMILIVHRPRGASRCDGFYSVRDACIVMLVGSFGISLNNSRLFWLLLGVLLLVWYSDKKIEHREGLAKNSVLVNPGKMTDRPVRGGRLRRGANWSH